MTEINDWQNLSSLAGSTFILSCPGCEHQAEVTATQLMIHKGGAAKFKDVWKSTKCTKCGRTGKPTVRIIE